MKKKKKMVHVIIRATWQRDEFTKVVEGDIEEKNLHWLYRSENEIREKLVKIEYEITELP